jgi:DNA polymerase-3 subunit alpha
LVDRRGDIEAANVIVSDLIPLEEVKARAFEGLFLRFREGEHSEETLEAAAEVARAYPGQQPVSITIELADGTVIPMRSDSFRVAFSPGMIEELERLLGKSNVRAVFGSPFRSNGNKTRGPKGPGMVPANNHRRG